MIGARTTPTLHRSYSKLLVMPLNQQVQFSGMRAKQYRTKELSSSRILLQKNTAVVGTWRTWGRGCSTPKTAVGFQFTSAEWRATPLPESARHRCRTTHHGPLFSRERERESEGVSSVGQGSGGCGCVCVCVFLLFALVSMCWCRRQLVIRVCEKPGDLSLSVWGAAQLRKVLKKRRALVAARDIAPPS